MHIQIDGKEITAESGETVLDAAERSGIGIPSLCRPGAKVAGACGNGSYCGAGTSCLVCLVKIGGRFVPSCAAKAEEGMVIESETEEVHAMRRSALELLLSDHVSDCRSCGARRSSCKLLKYMAKYRADRHRFGNAADNTAKKDPITDNHDVHHGKTIRLDEQKCIKCGICVLITQNRQEKIGLTFLGRGFDTRIGPPFDVPLETAVGKCAEEIAAACPTAAFLLIS